MFQISYSLSAFTLISGSLSWVSCTCNKHLVTTMTKAIRATILMHLHWHSLNLAAHLDIISHYDCLSCAFHQWRRNAVLPPRWALVPVEKKHLRPTDMNSTTTWPIPVPVMASMGTLGITLTDKKNSSKKWWCRLNLIQYKCHCQTMFLPGWLG